MKTELKQIKNYLLLIDTKSEMSIGNYIVTKDLSGIAKVKGYKKRYFLVIDIFQNIELGIGYDQTPECNKIIAYRKINQEAKELDLPLLPPFKEEEEKQFSLEDVKKAFQAGTQSGYEFCDLEHYYREQESQLPNEEIPDEDEEFEEFIQSLFTQQLPKDFIPIMKCGRCYKPDDSEEECWSAKECSRHNGDYKDLLKTIINLEGKEELVGKYTF